MAEMNEILKGSVVDRFDVTKAMGIPPPPSAGVSWQDRDEAIGKAVRKGDSTFAGWMDGVGQKIEAAKLQVQVLLGALPYLHQRLPLAVDVQARQAVALAVHVGLGEGAAGSLDEAVDRAATVLDLLPDAPEGSEQYQGLGDGRTGDV